VRCAALQLRKRAQPGRSERGGGVIQFCAPSLADERADSALAACLCRLARAAHGNSLAACVRLRCVARERWRAGAADAACDAARARWCAAARRLHAAACADKHASACSAAAAA
jgi:hypothetical protein